LLIKHFSSFFARPKKEISKYALMPFFYSNTLLKDGSLLVFTSGMRGSTSFPCPLKAISLNAKRQIGLENFCSGWI
jgi:hypothetical protein